MALVVQTLIFYLLAVICLVSAWFVVSSGNIVRSAFSLVLTFTAIGGLYFSLNADFVAAAQILIYVGAITIIMLFGIMLTARAEAQIENTGILVRYVGGVAAFILMGFLATFIGKAKWEVRAPEVTDTARVLGRAFFSEYLMPFEMASVLLLMAMIGAIVLARKGVKRV